MNKIFIIGLLGFLIITTGCLSELPEENPLNSGNGSDVPSSGEGSPNFVVESYLESYASPGENLSVYVHPEAPNRTELVLEETEQKNSSYIKRLRNNSRFSQINTSLVSSGQNESVVRVSGLAGVRVDGEVFTENFEERVRLRKYNGTWKIWSSVRNE